MFQKLLNTDTGIFLCSILLGLGLSGIVKVSCDTNDCIIYKHKNLKTDDYIKYNSECYKVKKMYKPCDNSKEIIGLK